MQSRNSDFTGRIFRIALPLILQQLCLQLQIWIDRAMLGHLNAEYFSAVGNALVPYNAAVAIVNAICGGTAILAAHRVGERDMDGLRRVARASFAGNSLFSALAFLFFLFFSDAVFGLMGVGEGLLEGASAYLSIVSFSLPVLGPVSTATAILQGFGLTKMIMLTGIVGNLLNIVLDWLLIFGRAGFPALGLEGAALATAAANLISATILLLYVLRSPALPFRGGKRAAGERLLRGYGQVLKMGLPSGLEYALWHLGNMFVVSYLNRLDIMAAGIYTLIFSIETLPLLIYMGFANAGLTLVGQETGAHEPGRARRAGFRCLGFAALVCLGVAALFLALPKGILGLFTDELTLVEYAAPYLMFTAAIMFPKAVNAVIGLCIRGTGDTRWMLMTQVFGTVFVIVCARLLIFRAGLGLMGIFVTLLADESLRGIMNLIRFRIRTGRG